MKRNEKAIEKKSKAALNATKKGKRPIFEHRAGELKGESPVDIRFALNSANLPKDRVQHFPVHRNISIDEIKKLPPEVLKLWQERLKRTVQILETME